MADHSYLSTLPVFSGVAPEDLEAFVANSFEKTLTRHEELFKTGDKREVFFIVLHGEIAVVRQLGDITQIVEIIPPGDYIVEHALFNPDSSHSHTALAYSQTAVVLGIRGKDFQKLSLELRYHILLNLLPLISNNFSHASNRIITLFQVGQIIGNEDQSTEDLCAHILITLLDAIKAEKALIALRTSNPLKIIVRGAEGMKSDFVGKTMRITDDPILFDIIDQGTMVNISESEYLMGSKKVDYVDRSVIGVPLTVGPRTIGALLLIDKKNERGFNANNEALLNIIAKMTALEIQQAEKRKIDIAQEEMEREYITV